MVQMIKSWLFPQCFIDWPSLAPDWSSVSFWLVKCQPLIGGEWQTDDNDGDHPLPLVNQSHAQQRWSSQITMLLTPGQGGIFWRTLSYTLLHTLSYTLLLLHSAAMLQPPCYNIYLPLLHSPYSPTSLIVHPPPTLSYTLLYSPKLSYTLLHYAMLHPWL